MSSITRFPGSNGESDTVEEARIRRLIVDAGQPTELPAEDLQAIRAAARAAWRSAYQEQRPGPASAAASGSFWATVALAAAVIVALGVATWWLGRAGGEAPSPASLLVERVLGTASIDPDGSGPAGSRPLLIAERLASGTVIETPNGTLGAALISGVGLRFAEGLTVRVDQGSRIRWIGEGVIELEAGAVYVDAFPGADGPDLEVRTPLGAARHIGTQFEVRWIDGEVSATRVRVREGSVLFYAINEAPAATVTAGDEWTLAEDGSVVTGRVEPWDPEWDWVQSSAPQFDLRGRTVGEYLAWLARETGWTIRFASPELEAQIGPSSVDTGGNLGDFRPDETADLVLDGARLDGRLIDGVLVISRQAE